MSVPTVLVDIAFQSDPGASPVWTDVSSFVREVHTRRGRQRELDRIEAGTCVVLLDNRDRRFDPTNANSPYYPNVVPMRRVRVRAVWNSITYSIFTGFIEAWTQEWPDGRDAIAVVSGVDAFKVLRNSRLNGNYPQERSDLRIARALNDSNWPTTDRALNVGKSDVQAGQVATTTLEHLQLVAQSENGLVFIDGQGRVVFHDRHHRIKNQSASQGVFGDATNELPYIGLRPSYDDATIWNDVRVTRVGGTTQTATDAASQTKYLQRILERSGLLIVTDAEAAQAARWLLSVYANPDIRFDEITLAPRMQPTSLWPLALGLEFGDRITVKRRPPGTGQTLERECHIEGVQHDVVHGLWTTTFQLSPANPQAFWVLGSPVNSVLGSTTRIAY